MQPHESHQTKSFEVTEKHQKHPLQFAERVTAVP